jgi:hypothetical protein
MKDRKNARRRRGIFDYPPYLLPAPTITPSNDQGFGPGPEETHV